MNPEIDRVVASDPLIVDASVNGARFLRRLDSGRQTLLLGRGADDSSPPAFTQVMEGRLVVQYGKDDHLVVLEVASGETERTVLLGPSEIAVGARDGQVVTVAPSTAEPGAQDVAYTVRSTDPATGRVTVLGAVPGASGLEVATGINTPYLAGDLLVTPTQEGVTAYALPAGGRPAAPVDPREAAVDDLCPAVSVATKRALGMLEPDAPPPATCRWNARTTTDGLLLFEVTAFAIDGGAKAAHAAAAKYARADRPAMQPLPGIGDEAWSRDSRDETLTSYELVTRSDDAVLLVSARYSRSSGDEPPAGWQRAVQQAAKELLAELARRR